MAQSDKVLVFLCNALRSARLWPCPETDAICSRPVAPVPGEALA